MDSLPTEKVRDRQQPQEHRDHCRQPVPEIPTVYVAIRFIFRIVKGIVIVVVIQYLPLLQSPSRYNRQQRYPPNPRKSPAKK